MKFDAKVAITPIPIIFENFILNCSLMSAKTSLNLVCCDDQIVIETITPPRTIAVSYTHLTLPTILLV